MSLPVPAARTLLNPLGVVLCYLAGLIASLYIAVTMPVMAALALLAATLLASLVFVKSARPVAALLTCSFLMLGLLLGSARQLDLAGSQAQSFLDRGVWAEVSLGEKPKLRGAKASFSGRMERFGVDTTVLKANEDILVELFCREECQAVTGAGWEEGSRIRVKGRFQRLPASPGNGFDYGAFLRQRGINAVLAAASDQVELLPERRGGFSGLVDKLRRHARSSLRLGGWGDAGSLLQGMVLGDADQVPAEIVAAFRDSGLLHLLAVSGQNVVLLGFIVLLLCRVVQVPRLAAAAIAVLVICLYIPLTGAGPSIVRAGIVGILGLLAHIFSRQADRYHFLALAAAAIMTLNPFSFWDPGFQLSFAAVLAIFFLAPVFSSWLKILPSFLGEAAAISSACALATAPISLAHFQQVSLAGLPANIAAAPAAAPIMLLGTLSIILSPLSSQLCWLINALAALCAGFLISLACFFASLPGAVYATPGPGAWSTVVYYGLLALGVWICRKPPFPLAAFPKFFRSAIRSKAGKTLALLILTLALALTLALLAAFVGNGGSNNAASSAYFTASFFDVGQGDAALLQVAGGSSILIDGGPGAGVIDWLDESGVERLDAVIASHSDADHLEGLVAVLNRYPVNAVFDGAPSDPRPLYRDFLQAAARQGASYSVLREGQKLVFGDLVLNVLNPRGASQQSSNAGSVVLAAGYHGLDILYPGDAEGETLSSLNLPPVEVLKVSHHGSRDGKLQQVLDKTKPLLAVISVGRGNSYGHPAADALDLLRKSGAKIYRTDEQGTIRLSLTENGIEIGTSN